MAEDIWGGSARDKTERTIQGKIEAVLSRMVGVPVEVVGSGRTDAGVHALGQVANCRLDTDWTLEEIQEYLNHYLPEDIVVKELEEAEDRFHARHNAQGRRYVYRIWNHRVPSALERRYSYHVPQRLDLDSMRQAAAKLVGTHDFIAFSSLKAEKVHNSPH